MYLLSVARFLASIVSAALLTAAGYLLWTWYQGDWVRDPVGVFARHRDGWRLAAGCALLAWCALGRFILPLGLARRGARVSRPRHGLGEMRSGASGSSLYVESVGPAGAPLLLFTHGWGMDSTFWDSAKRDLGGRFRVVVWDLPGLGRSKPPPGGKIALANFAADLAGLLQEMERPAVLVGHSIGGMTIQTLVRDHPGVMDRVAGVVLLNTTFTNPLRTMVLGPILLALQKPVLEPSAYLTAWLQPLIWLSKWLSYLSGSVHAALRLGFGRRVARDQLEHAALLATRAPPAVEAKGDLAMFHWDATGAMARFRKPLLVIGGELDIVTRPSAGEAIAAQTPTGAARVIPGVNHMGPLERADLYNAAIADFAMAVPLSAPVGDTA